MKIASPLAWKLCGIAAQFAFLSSPSSAAPPRLQLVPIAENQFSSPVAIANAGDGSGRLFVVEQRGTVHIIEADGTVHPEPFLDISDKLVPERPGFDERGLLSIAFHPNYQPGVFTLPGADKFYVYYSAPSPNAPGTDEAPVDHMSVVAEYSLSADDHIALPDSENVLLTFDQPQFNHDGGQLAFGPDGMLYISTGDGGGSDDNDAGHTGGSGDKPDGGLGNAQDLKNLLGKILRISVTGTGGWSIPEDNPFALIDDGSRGEIYAYGLRNPWRFSFDREGSNQLFCADVGQGSVEEVNIVEIGKNYGWRRFEGAFDFDTTAPISGNETELPIGQYAHPGAEVPGLLEVGTSITGGYVYRGALIPDLQGTYVFGDWTASFSNPSGTLLALEPDGANGFDLSPLDIAGGNPLNLFVPCFGEDESGEIYVAGKTTLAPSATDPVSGSPTGSIFKLALAPPLAPLPKVRLEPVVEAAFPSPVQITHTGEEGDGRLFVVDQRGTVHIITGDGTLLPEPFLDISDKLVPERPGFDERGLLSIAFHPNFDSNVFTIPGSSEFYVCYSAPSPNAPGTDEDPVDHMTVIAEYVALDPNMAVADSERILMTFDQPQFNHNGGQLAFGPDGLLYISTGDGGGSDDNDAGHTGGSEEKPDGGLGNSQDLKNLLGKMLRIDPLGSDGGLPYGLPPDNPFVLPDTDFLPEIYAWGLRNPWRFSFDGDRLFCADVGQGNVEEVNLIEVGGNYGWRRFEGAFDFDPTAPTGPAGAGIKLPIAQYGHLATERPGIPRIGTSITGGEVYRGSDSPGLDGAYLFADWTNSFSSPNGTLLALTTQDDGATWDLGALDVEGGNPIGMFVPCFGRDVNGEVYVAGKTTLAPSAGDPVTGGPTGGVFKIVEIGSTASGPETISIEPVADTTIFEETAPKANGAGRYLFSGHTASPNNGLERRALLEFDIAAAVPAGATIDAATASLGMNKDPRAGDVSSSFGLHRLLSDWGEGTVNASNQEGRGAPATDGSATWLSTALNEGPDWATAGGDFEASPSASVAIASVRRRYEWTSAQLAADVQSWLDEPATNFGWMLFSDSDASASARRFDSREATNEANRPNLEIEFTAPPSGPSYRDTWLDQFFPGGTFPGDLSDGDGDTLNALFEYGGGTDPTAADDPSGFFELSVDPNGGVSVRFRRDPRADDLTYTVEMSTDLLNWTRVATSSGGTPTHSTPGSSVVESNVPGSFPIKSVSVELPFSPPDVPAVNLRLRIDRNE